MVTVINICVVNVLHSSEAKQKEEILVVPDIRKLMFDSNFEASMRTKEKENWI